MEGSGWCSPGNTGKPLRGPFPGGYFPGPLEFPCNSIPGTAPSSAAGEDLKSSVPGGAQMQEQLDVTGVNSLSGS